MGNLFLLLFLKGLSLAWCEPILYKSLPPRPDYFVLDESKTLDPSAMYTLQTLVTEHSRLTGQRFMIAVLKNLEGIPVSERTHELFTRWHPANTQGKAVLLVVDWDQKKAAIETGYELEPFLTESKNGEMIDRVVAPELRRNHLQNALISGSYAILDLLESPLIQSGKANELLRRARLDHSLDLKTDHFDWTGWFVPCSLGLLLGLVVWIQMSAQEAYFTGKGWFRLRPWVGIAFYRRKRKTTDPYSEEHGASGDW